MEVGNGIIGVFLTYRQINGNKIAYYPEITFVGFMIYN